MSELRPCNRRLDIARRHVRELEQDVARGGTYAALAALELPAARAFLRLCEDIARDAATECVGGAQ